MGLYAYGDGGSTRMLAFPLLLALTACGSASTGTAAAAPHSSTENSSTAAQAGVDDPPSSNPVEAKVAGVAIGMTAEQAITAIKRFDPAYKVQTRYLAMRPVEFGQRGQPLGELAESGSNDLPRKYAILNDIFAKKSNSTDKCDPYKERGSMPMCYTVQNAPEDTVTIWLSRDPANERVIAVERSVDYNTHPVPFASLESGISRKYPWAPSYMDHRNTATLYEDWKWDRSGAQQRFSSLNDSAHGAIPDNVQPGQGRGISVYIEWANGNPQLAGVFKVSLYDSNALYESVNQGLTTFNAAKLKWDTEQAGGHQSERTKM